MPNDNRISADITAATKATILTKIQEIQALVTFLINLTPEERRSIPSIAAGRAGMIDIYLQQMTANSGLVPSFVNMTELNGDKKLYLDLQELIAPVAGLLEALTDTKQVAGSDMYLAFLSYFNNVREAQRRNVPGADALLTVLQPFFARGPRNPSPVNPPPPNP